MTEDTELLAELRSVWARVPLPRDLWHPWSETIRQLHEDVRTALAALADDEEGRRALARLLADEAQTTAPAAPADAVAAAIGRLAALPRPDGKHPYLEDVLPGLEAAEALLGAVAHSPAARRRFAELRRGPAATPAGSSGQSGSSASGGSGDQASARGPGPSEPP